MAELHVELVAADRQVWSGRASLVVARTTSGDIGIMPGHQPLLGVLQSGPVIIRTTGETGQGTVVAAVHGGFLSYTDGKLSLLAEIAELADEIDVERAQRALEQARAEADEVAERRADVRLRAVAAGR
ncbi:F0F1 ATP synthase subunit epsilon [Streptomyces litchfieldiae]|uniref:ATP synthase epsilon chain n=1 Tax=Streptomyces litchfieldiae TaxID=3075543 RepID=A0ABU2MIK3_9ACTN|nr:F0F1 ATP synthase subunit epsilon [Streptomyces sp. DSM 44938]MDT0341422.1 F0F1 ATP synthase subunit epsilon [Streptomyces sp. DSM 44938]